MRGTLVIAVLCVAVGLGILFAFCHGTTALSVAYPFSGASVHIDVTTTGIPALIGLTVSAIGALLLIIATFIALAGILSRRHREKALIKRRETAFEE